MLQSAAFFKKEKPRERGSSKGGKKEETKARKLPMNMQSLKGGKNRRDKGLESC